MYVNKFGNLVFAVITVILMAAALLVGQNAGATIKITVIPPAASGSATVTKLIGGVAHERNLTDCKVVVYTHTDTWYVQPTVANPYTVIGNDGRWRTVVHPGAEYAALLVRSSYRPESTTDALPAVGGDVLAEDVQPGK
jgi:hypothetical protein